MLLARVAQQCIVLRCIWWLLGFSFCLQCVPFMILLVSAFSFIASVTVIDDDRIQPSHHKPNLRTRDGLDAVKF